MRPSRSGGLIHYRAAISPDRVDVANCCEIDQRIPGDGDLIGGLRDRGVVAALLDEATQSSGTHHAGDALAVDPLVRWDAVVELGSDPRDALGIVSASSGAGPWMTVRTR